MMVVEVMEVIVMAVVVVVSGMVVVAVVTGMVVVVADGWLSVPADGGDGLKQECGEALELWLGEVGHCTIDGEEDFTKPPPQPPPPPVPPPPTAPPSEHHHHHHQQLPPQEPHPALGLEDEAAWGPLTSHPTAPLTHLETLTHSTFMQKSELGGDGAVGVGVGGMPAEELAVEAVIPPPTPWFPCPQCGKSFRTRITLTRHEKIHKGNAFPCPLCPKVFYQVSNVKYHVHAVHGRQYETPVRGSHEAL